MKTFTEIKEEIVEARDEARRDAREYKVIRSRGAWLAVLDGNRELLSETGVHEITTLKALKRDIQYFIAKGGMEFYIDGGFDGADSLNDLNEDPVIWISSWTIPLDVN
jgi:hypothetical protein